MNRKKCVQKNAAGVQRRKFLLVANIAARIRCLVYEASNGPCLSFRSVKQYASRQCLLEAHEQLEYLEGLSDGPRTRAAGRSQEHPR
jgi:hypothetical protein